MKRRRCSSRRKPSTATACNCARGGLSLAAQAVAASTDFAPLSVWAASSEIGVLRMQSYNGAIQLHEKLLSDYPGSKQAPLALYRLGWAYRNVSLAGAARLALAAAFAAAAPIHQHAQVSAIEFNEEREREFEARHPGALPDQKP